MMAIILFIRFVQNKLGQKAMRVIGENALDVTALLVLPPKNIGKSSQPDFVNVQAIYARALVQSLAFPRMEPAIQQLFSNRPGTPGIMSSDAAKVLPLGVPLTFGQVIKTLQKVRNEDDCCLGYRMADGTLKICPCMSAAYTYQDGDRIIIVSRVAATGEGVGGGDIEMNRKPPSVKGVKQNPSGGKKESPAAADATPLPGVPAE